MTQTNILLESGTNELEIVEFHVDLDGYEGHYGLNVAKVVEIIRRQKVTSMPEMRHPAILGAFSHRNGRVVPLVDIAKYLHSNPITNPDAKIIVTEFNTVSTAFLVSGVNRIYRLSWTDVEAPSKLMQDMSHNAVTGVVRLDERVVFLLDLEAIVATLHPGMAIRMEERAGQEIPEQFTILHADDSSSIRRLVAQLLEKEGRFKLIQAVDGQEAWEKLVTIAQNCESRGVSLTSVLQGVISDIEMPLLDGLTLCKQIKEHPLLKRLPVCMFSSLISDSLVHKCKSVGADMQFSKPDLQGISDFMYNFIRDHHIATPTGGITSSILAEAGYGQGEEEQGTS